MKGWYEGSSSDSMEVATHSRQRPHHTQDIEEVCATTHRPRKSVRAHGTHRHTNHEHPCGPLVFIVVATPISCTSCNATGEHRRNSRPAKAARRTASPLRRATGGWLRSDGGSTCGTPAASNAVAMMSCICWPWNLRTIALCHTHTPPPPPPPVSPSHAASSHAAYSQMARPCFNLTSALVRGSDDASSGFVTHTRCSNAVHSAASPPSPSLPSPHPPPAPHWSSGQPARSGSGTGSDSIACGKLPCWMALTVAARTSCGKHTPCTCAPISCGPTNHIVSHARSRWACDLCVDHPLTVATRRTRQLGTSTV